jgi:hypothetical protein
MTLETGQKKTLSHQLCLPPLMILNTSVIQDANSEAIVLCQPLLAFLGVLGNESLVFKQYSRHFHREP